MTNQVHDAVVKKRLFEKMRQFLPQLTDEQFAEFQKEFDAYIDRELVLTRSDEWNQYTTRHGEQVTERKVSLSKQFAESQKRIKPEDRI